MADHNISKNKNGFTLVELAIVLMIIGLLIGGVLRGQELMENARVSSTVQQIKAYEGAIVTFRDAFAALPGDIVTAQQRIPGCSGNCISGNGNGIIGDFTGGDSANDYPFANVSNAINSENTQFWKHLALAHLISGINPSASVPEWGKSHPVAKIGGGFFVRHTQMAVSVLNISGDILLLRRDISGNIGGCPSDFCAISPLRGVQIDRKMDDGISNTGSVWSVSHDVGCGTPNNGNNGPTGYNETVSDQVCDMMFKID